MKLLTSLLLSFIAVASAPALAANGIAFRDVHEATTGTTMPATVFYPATGPSGATDLGPYRVAATPEVARALFLDYLASASRLHRRPAWYHTLTTNCTTLIREHVNKAHAYERWDWRLLANGHLDKRLYTDGYLDQSLPFSELKKRSFINPAAIAAGDAPDFSDRIRRDLPGF